MKLNITNQNKVPMIATGCILIVSIGMFGYCANSYIKYNKEFKVQESELSTVMEVFDQNYNELIGYMENANTLNSLDPSDRDFMDKIATYEKLVNYEHLKLKQVIGKDVEGNNYNSVVLDSIESVMENVNFVYEFNAVFKYKNLDNAIREIEGSHINYNFISFNSSTGEVSIQIKFPPKGVQDETE